MARKALGRILDLDNPVPVQTNLFLDPSVKVPDKLQMFPPIGAGLEDFARTLEAAEREGNLGLDLEFSEKTLRPTILGIASKERCVAVPWDDGLAKKALAVSGQLVGHAVIDADKPVLEKKLGIDTPLSKWEDTLLEHYLCNSDFAAAPGKTEDEDDATALGLMNIWAMASLYTTLPQWKLCVRAGSKVRLANGKSERIEKLVRDKYAGDVLCVDPKTGRLVQRRVVGWYKNKRAGRRLYSLGYGEYGRKRVRSCITEDHPVLTDSGWRPIRDVKPTDKIATGTPGFSKRALEFLVGMTLGDSHVERKTGRFRIFNTVDHNYYVHLKRGILNHFAALTYVETKADARHKDLLHVLFSAQPAFRWWGQQPLSLLLDNFSVASLAIWYMDDGHRSAKDGNAEIACASLPKEHAELFAAKIRSFGIDAKVSIRPSLKRPRITFNRTAAKALFKTIGPYVTPCLRYKLDDDAPPFDLSLYTNEPTCFWGTPDIQEVLCTPGEDTVYCLDVEEFHNFCLMGGVVHNCRGIACMGPCPRHDVFGYCLRGDQTVFLANGRKERISSLVQRRATDEVLCINENGAIVKRQITGWFKNKRGDRRFVRVRYIYGGEGNHGVFSVVVTEDHRFLTKRGYVAASELKPTDKIATGTPALSGDQMGLLSGVLLGDSHLRKGDLTIANLERVDDYVKLKAKALGNMPHTFYRNKTNTGVLSVAFFTVEPFWKWLSIEVKNFVTFAEEHMNVAGLAVWYLDDGSCDGHTMSISVSSLTIEEISRLSAMLKQRFGLDARISLAKEVKPGQNHTKKTIYFTAQSSRYLSELIGRYTPPTLRYKLRSHDCSPPEFDAAVYALQSSETFWTQPIVTPVGPRVVKSVANKENTVYCISVAECENFITEGGVVHNCAVDAWAGLASHYELVGLMERRGVPRAFYHDLKKLNVLCAEMTRRGVKVDTAFVRKLEEEFDARKLDLFPYEGEGKKKVYGYRDEEGQWIEAPFNPQSPAAIVQYFADQGITLKGKGGKVKADKETIRKTLERALKDKRIPYSVDKKSSLLTLEDEGQLEYLPPPVKLLYTLDTYKSSGKGLKSWFDAKYIREGNLVHPRFIVPGTSTGRLASSAPNFMNVPKSGFGVYVRRAIIPREKGLQFLIADKAQLEARVVFFYAGIEAPPHDFFAWLVDRSGGKFSHAAARIGRPEREVAKSVVYGFQYLEGLVCLTEEELRSQRRQKEIREGALLIFDGRDGRGLWTVRNRVVGFTGANLSERLFGDRTNLHRKEALAIQEVYSSAFPQVREWHKGISREVDRGLAQSHTGRFLELYGTPEDDLKLTAAFMGQGGGADEVQEGMLRFWDLGQVPLLQIHDELVFEVPADWTDEQCLKFMGTFAEPSQRFGGRRFPIEVSVGTSWYKGDRRTLGKL